MELVISSLVGGLIGLLLGVAFEETLFRFRSHIANMVTNQIRRNLSPEPRIENLIDTLASLTPVDPLTRRVMQLAGHETPIASDRCFEILHSHLYAGWTAKDIEFTYDPKPIPLPSDLRLIVDQNLPDPPNNGKYRLCSLGPDSSEKPILQIGLAPTDYFSTVPIQRQLYESVLVSAGGGVCSPWEKYGQDLLNFEQCRLPNIVCLHVIVTMPKSKLLIIQRSPRELDWELGRWSLSFEEQMNSGWNVRRPDLGFFDTIKAGLAEELGCDDANDPDIDIRDMRILSLVMDSVALNVDVVALVSINNSLDEIRARWQLLSRDGQVELRRLEQLNWTISALAPILCGLNVQIGDLRIAADEWNLSSRMRMLVALFHKYGIKKTIAELKAWEAMSAVVSSVKE